MNMHYTAHGILQARVLEWVTFPFSRGSSQPRDQTQVSRIAGRFFTSWAPREAQEYWSGWSIPSPVDLPDPGIKLGSPALQADSLATELSGKPSKHHSTAQSAYVEICIYIIWYIYISPHMRWLNPVGTAYIEEEPWIQRADYKL